MNKVTDLLSAWPEKAPDHRERIQFNDYRPAHVPPPRSLTPYLQPRTRPRTFSPALDREPAQKEKPRRVRARAVRDAEPLRECSDRG